MVEGNELEKMIKFEKISMTMLRKKISETDDESIKAMLKRGLRTTNRIIKIASSIDDMKDGKRKMKMLRELERNIIIKHNIDIKIKQYAVGGAHEAK